MRDIKEIIIHCTDSDDSLDVGFRQINEWHRERGWLSPSGVSCGYHYIIKRDGSVEIGRPESEKGAHVRGHNSNSLGIVLVGRKDSDEKQLDELFDMVTRLCQKHDVDFVDGVFGHYELDDGKTCPNLDMVKFRAELAFK
jgi:N-acetylmuramoyl-L-alanine amidase